MLKRIYIILSIMIGLLSLLLFISSLILNFSILFPLKFFITNILSLIVLVICSSKLINNDDSIIHKIVPIVVLICMFATIIDCHVLDIKGLSAKGTIIGDAANIISNFITSCYAAIIPLILIDNFEVYNKFNKIAKKIGYGLVGVTFLSLLYVMIKVENVSIIYDLLKYAIEGIENIEIENLSNYNLFIAAFSLEVGLILSMYFIDFAFDKGDRKHGVKMSALDNQGNVRVESVAKQISDRQKASDYFATEESIHNNNINTQMNLGNDLLLNSNVGQVDMPMAEGVSNVEITPAEQPVVAPKEPKVEEPVQKLAPVEQPAAVQEENKVEMSAQEPVANIPVVEPVQNVALAEPVPTEQPTPEATPVEQSVVVQEQPKVETPEENIIIIDEPTPESIIKTEPVVNDKINNDTPTTPTIVIEEPTNTEVK